MEGQQGPDIIENNIFTELSIGKEEMLYSLNSTLEALEDESILKEEYYVRFDTLGFQYESGCQTEPNPHDFELLKSEVRSTFEAVENGRITEEDYYFVLVTPYFYYRSGNYNKRENLQSTLQALVDTYNDESGNELLQEQIVATFEEWIESLEVTIVLHAAQLENEIPKVEVSFQILLGIITYLLKILLHSVSKQDSVGSTYKPFDFVDGGSPDDEQSDIKGYFQILLGIFTCMPTDPYLPDSNKDSGICIVCCYCLRPFVAGRRIRPGKKKQSSSCTVSVFLFLGFFAVAIPSAQAAHQETPLTLRAGSNGVIPFNCSVRDPPDVSNVYYTVRFEAKDRPFCVDGAFDPEGFISPDQSERFSTKINVDINTLAVNINIAFVSTDDEGTYELQTLYNFGSKDVESNFMTQVVKVHVPPGPAKCFFTQYENSDRRLVHCHCRPGSGNSTLSCFQNGEKIPFIKEKEVTSRKFWIMEETSPVVCCSHELGEEVTADTCGQQFRFPRHKATTTVPPRTQNKEGSVAEDLPIPTEVKLPKAVEEPMVKGSGCAMRSSLLFPTLFTLLTFLIYQ